MTGHREREKASLSKKDGVKVMNICHEGSQSIHNHRDGRIIITKQTAKTKQIIHDRFSRRLYVDCTWPLSWSTFSSHSIHSSSPPASSPPASSAAASSAAGSSATASSAAGSSAASFAGSSAGSSFAASSAALSSAGLSSATASS